MACGGLESDAVNEVLSQLTAQQLSMTVCRVAGLAATSHIERFAHGGMAVAAGRGCAELR